MTEFGNVNCHWKGGQQVPKRWPTLSLDHPFGLPAFQDYLGLVFCRLFVPPVLLAVCTAVAMLTWEQWPLYT